MANTYKVRKNLYLLSKEGVMNKIDLICAIISILVDLFGVIVNLLRK